MKKIIFLLLLLIPVVSAADSINDIMQDVDEYYYIVLGDDSVGADTLSATEIALGLQKHNNQLDTPTVLEDEISPNVPRILIGPPCGSQYMESALGYSCDFWPYSEGEAIIKVYEDSIIVTGTTPNDRRRAGLILAEYPTHEILGENSFVLISGTSLDPVQLNLDVAKTEGEFVCGDGVCEPGETFLCFPDCNKKTCFDICQEEGFQESFCREVPSNPNVDICQSGEVNKGLQYCTAERSCCCKLLDSNEVLDSENEGITLNESSTNELVSKEDNKIKIIVTSSIILLSVILLLAFIFTR